MITEIPGWGWGVRVTGLVAWGALWWAMLFGVAVSGKGAGGWLHVPSAAELHRQWATVGLVASVVHALATVVAPEGGVPAWAVLVPLVSPVQRGVVAVGTLALWGFAALVVSSWTRPRWGPEVWRAVHALAFGAWVLALGHTFVGGTDLRNDLVRAVLLGASAVLFGAVAQRIVVAGMGRRGTLRA